MTFLAVKMYKIHTNTEVNFMELTKKNSKVMY